MTRNTSAQLPHANIVCTNAFRSTHETSGAQASALVTLPDATSPAAFMKWANSLPASNPPTWLGLAPNAEAALLATRGEQLLSTWQVTDAKLG